MLLKKYLKRFSILRIVFQNFRICDFIIKKKIIIKKYYKKVFNNLIKLYFFFHVLFYLNLNHININLKSFKFLGL